MNAKKKQTNENDDMEKQMAELERLSKEIDDDMKELDKLMEAGKEPEKSENSEEGLNSQVSELERLEKQIDEEIKKLDALDSENESQSTSDSENPEQVSAAEARDLLKKLADLRRVFGEMGTFMDKLDGLCQKANNAVSLEATSNSDQGTDKQ